MRDPLARVTGLTGTPQSQPIPGREAEMTRNNAGGFTFAKDLWTKLEDFIVLGTEGGTYYLGEDRLTSLNVSVVTQAIKTDGVRAVELATEISTARPPRAFKSKPAIFVLAAALAQGDLETRRAVRARMYQVARTTDHLSAFWGYYKALSGKRIGRIARGTLAGWFLNGTTEQVAWKALKARQRRTPQGEPLALRDVLRIAHPQADTCEREALFGWLAGNVSDDIARQRVEAIDAYLEAQAVRTIRQAVQVVTERKVPWEYLPDQMQAQPEVWDALIDTVGITALIRNLARMTQMGLLKPMSAANARVARRLTDADELARGRIHPMDVFLALRVYNSGQAQPSPKAPVRRWRPVALISDALEEGYELAFGNVRPTGKRLLVAVDSSGSMRNVWSGTLSYGGSPLGSPYEIGCAMAVILARTEPNVHVIDVDTLVHPSKVTKRTNLREIASWMPFGGGTNLSLPFEYAQRERLEVDGFIVFTDNETWAGYYNHPGQALESYRRRINPAARAVVASMTAAGHTIADPKDEGVLQMAGMDASLPKVATGFVRG